MSGGLNTHCLKLQVEWFGSKKRTPLISTNHYTNKIKMTKNWDFSHFQQKY